jgi:hypothetical protein
MMRGSVVAGLVANLLPMVMPTLMHRFVSFAM